MVCFLPHSFLPNWQTRVAPATSWVARSEAAAPAGAYRRQPKRKWGFIPRAAKRRSSRPAPKARNPRLRGPQAARLLLQLLLQLIK